MEVFEDQNQQLLQSSYNIDADNHTSYLDN
jgi:hypothetical protein